MPDRNTSALLGRRISAGDYPFLGHRNRPAHRAEPTQLQAHGFPQTPLVRTREESNRLLSDPVGIWKSSLSDDSDLFFEVRAKGSAFEGRILAAPPGSPWHHGDVMMKLRRDRDGSFVGELKVLRASTNEGTAIPRWTWTWTDSQPKAPKARSSSRISQWTPIRLVLAQVAHGHAGMWGQSFDGEYYEVSASTSDGKRSRRLSRHLAPFRAGRGCCGEWFLPKRNLR